MTVSTGNADVDQFQTALQAIVNEGWTVNANPPFPGVDPATGRKVSGWEDPSTKTVWVWPENIDPSHDVSSFYWQRSCKKMLWHEYGHVRWETRKFTLGEWRTVRKLKKPADWTTDTYDTRTREDHAEVMSYAHLTKAEREGIGFLFVVPGDWPSGGEMNSAQRN